MASMLISVAKNGDNCQQADKLIKIGEFARHFQISLDLLRLYERQGVLISLKSKTGRHYFTECDYVWVGILLRLVRDARLNLAQIRHLLAGFPCGRKKQCSCLKERCSVFQDESIPCWANRKHACGSAQNCYFCPVYREAPFHKSVTDVLAMPVFWRQRPPANV